MEYLASPYTSPDPMLRAERKRLAAAAAARLMLAGRMIYSPIVHGGAIEDHLPQEMPHDWWMRQCIAVLRRCDRLVVLRIPGWRESRGVTLEIEFAQTAGIPIEFVEA
jgi:hypothetical protein